VRSLIIGVVAVLALGVATQDGHCQKPDLAQLKSIASGYRFAMEVRPPGGDQLFIYANNRNRLFVYKLTKDGLELKWENAALGARAAGIVVSDLYGDGRLKLTVATARGRLLIYDLESFDLEYENIQNDYSSIHHLATANLDDDPQEELVLIANDRLYIVDGVSRAVQWNSQATFQASQIVIADVDDDPQLEIVLNTGQIVDSRFYSVEFEADQSFGDRIKLVDINGDGYLDVFGEFADFGLRVYDIYGQRELW